MISCETHKLRFDRAIADFMRDPRTIEMLGYFLHLSQPTLHDVKVIGEAFFAAGMCHGTNEILALQKQKQSVESTL